MSDENDKPRDDDWGMTMPHLRLAKDKNTDDFSDDFAPPKNRAKQPPADDWEMTQQNYNLSDNQPSSSSDYDKTTPNINILQENKPDEWGMTAPNLNVPREKKPDDWSMPAPVFRISEGESLDEVAKRTMFPTSREAGDFSEITPNFNSSEVSSREAFARNAPNLDLQPQPIISEQFPVGEINSAANQPAKFGGSKLIFIVVGLLAMILFAVIFLVGIYYLFFNNSAAAKKAAPIQEQQSRFAASSALIISPETVLPKPGCVRQTFRLKVARQFENDKENLRPARHGFERG